MPSRYDNALKALLLAITPALSMSSAFAAEFLFVGTYHTRGSKDACAQGAYLVKDADSEAELKRARDEFMSNQAFLDKRPERYRRGQAVAIYSYLSKDVNFMGSGKCSYTRYNSLAGRTTADAEKQVGRRRAEYPASFLSDPSIIYFWQGDNVQVKHP